MPAPKGNSNARKGTEWKDAIKYALANYEDLGRIERGQALKAIAKKMIEQAIDGDKDARKEIGERLDGKAVQAISGPEGESLFSGIEVSFVSKKED